MGGTLGNSVEEYRAQTHPLWTKQLRPLLDRPIWLGQKWAASFFLGGVDELPQHRWLAMCLFLFCEEEKLFSFTP